MHIALLFRTLLSTSLAFIATAGCYRYTYVERIAAPTLPPGTDVRVRLGAEEAERVGSILGRNDRVYDGRVVSEADSSLMLSVRSFFVQQGGMTESGYQHITIPRSSVVEMQLRTLDRPRTYTLVAISAVAATTAVIATFNAVRGKDDKGTKLPGERSRSPGLVIPLRFAIPH